MCVCRRPRIAGKYSLQTIGISQYEDEDVSENVSEWQLALCATMESAPSVHIEQQLSIKPS